VSVHAVDEGGTAVAFFHDLEIKRWMRCAVWRPQKEGKTVEKRDMEVILSGELGDMNGIHVWRPFASRSPDSGTVPGPKDLKDGMTSSLLQQFTLDTGDERYMNSFMTLQGSWLQSRRKILARCTDGTLEMWDREGNMKWRMLKPQGKLTGLTAESRLMLKDGAE